MKKITTDNLQLLKTAKSTFIDSAASASDSTLTTKSIIGFAIDQILLIGELGAEQREIIKTHASTSPTGTTITLASNLTYGYTVGTKVYIIDYNKVEISWSATATGSKAVLATIDLQADQKETIYSDTAKSAGYYFWRFKEDIGNTYSDYSDPIPYAGFETNTVKFVIDYALKRNKLEAYTDNVDKDFCINEINACLKYITGKMKRWSKLQKFNHILGQTAQGTWSYDLPSDIYDSNTLKSILGVRIGTDGDNLTPRNKDDFNDLYDGVARTTCSAASIGDTELTLANSYDFEAPTSGTASIMIAGVTITYTTNTKATGVLSGIPASGTGSITATITDSSNVWQNEAEGQLTKFSVWDGKIWTELPSSSYAGLNVHLDYWTEASEVDSYADTIDAVRYDLAKYWLTWAIRNQLKNDGKKDLGDGDFLMFSEILRDSMRKENKSHRKHWDIRLNQITP